MDSEYKRQVVNLPREAERRIRDGAELTKEFREFLPLAVARAVKSRPEGGSELTDAGLDVRRVVQLLILPSLLVSAEKSYEIFELTSNGNASGFMGARLIWEHETDRANLKPPPEKSELAHQLEPTISSQIVSLPLEQTTTLVDELTHLHLPVDPSPSDCFVLDGTSYEMTLGDPESWVKYHWWESPPLEWSDLGEIAERIVTLIEHTSESL